MSISKEYKYSFVQFVFYNLVMFFHCGHVLADPSGAGLLSACEFSMDSGFEGIKGQMCTWYVTPCDCEYSKDPQAPRVCLPEFVAIEALAKQVVNGLKAQPELQEKNAEVAAAIILSRTYPCSDN